MFRRIQFIGLLAAALLVLQPSPAAADAPAKEAPKPAAKNPAMDALRGLAGSWEPVGEAVEGMPRGSLVFKPTAANSALTETMFPGTDHEMLNVYTLDGDQVALTHYCSMGNQPHMKLKSFEKNVMAFEFVDGGNIKSRDEAHMDALEVTIDGDKLVEKWSFYRKGKVVSSHTFEFKRSK